MSRRCPFSQIVLSGYSQGAIVMHDVVDAVAATSTLALHKIAGAVLIADGDKPTDSTAEHFGTAAASSTGIRPYLRAIATVTDPARSVPTASVCDTQDIVCDFTMKAKRSQFQAAVAAHGSYDCSTTYQATCQATTDWLAARMKPAPDPRLRISQTRITTSEDGSVTLTLRAQTPFGIGENLPEYNVHSVLHYNASCWEPGDTRPSYTIGGYAPGNQRTSGTEFDGVYEISLFWRSNYPDFHASNCAVYALGLTAPPGFGSRTYGDEDFAARAVVMGLTFAVP